MTFFNKYNNLILFCLKINQLNKNIYFKNKFKNYYKNVNFICFNSEKF